MDITITNTASSLITTFAGAVRDNILSVALCAAGFGAMTGLPGYPTSAAVESTPAGLSTTPPADGPGMPSSTTIDHLTNARCVDASSVELTFADRLVARVTLAQLGLADSDVDLRTANVTPTGLAIKPTKGRRFVIDSATLRYAADPVYAAKIDKSIRDLHITPAEFDEAARLLHDQRWNEVGDEDDL
jgi:hypothetical protein